MVERDVVEQLEPCPFCGEHLIVRENCDGSPVILNGVPVMWHPFTDCILEGKSVSPEDREFYWNRRPLSPEFARAVEMCARVAEGQKPIMRGNFFHGQREQSDKIAKAIRALSPSPPVPDEVVEAARRIARAAAEFDAAQNSGDRWTASARLQEELNEDAHIVAVARALLHLLGEKATQEKETTT